MLHRANSETLQAERAEVVPFRQYQMECTASGHRLRNIISQVNYLEFLDRFLSTGSNLSIEHMLFVSENLYR
jgi:hypothetical protein